MVAIHIICVYSYFIETEQQLKGKTMDIKILIVYAVLGKGDKILKVDGNKSLQNIREWILENHEDVDQIIIL